MSNISKPKKFKTTGIYSSFVPSIVAILALVGLIGIHFQARSFEVSPKMPQSDTDDNIIKSVR